MSQKCFLPFFPHMAGVKALLLMMNASTARRSLASRNIFKNVCHASLSVVIRNVTEMVSRGVVRTARTMYKVPAQRAGRLLHRMHRTHRMR